MLEQAPHLGVIDGGEASECGWLRGQWANAHEAAASTAAQRDQRSVALRACVMRPTSALPLQPNSRAHRLRDGHQQRHNLLGHVVRGGGLAAKDAHARHHLRGRRQGGEQGRRGGRCSAAGQACSAAGGRRSGTASRRLHPGVRTADRAARPAPCCACCSCYARPHPATPSAASHRVGKSCDIRPAPAPPQPPPWRAPPGSSP